MLILEQVRLSKGQKSPAGITPCMNRAPLMARASCRCLLEIYNNSVWSKIEISESIAFSLIYQSRHFPSFVDIISFIFFVNMLPPSLTRIVLYCSAISVNYSVGCFNIIANILVHTTIAIYYMSVYLINLIICPSGVFT